MINFAVMKKTMLLIALLTLCRCMAFSQPLEFKGSEAASIGIYIVDLGSKRIVAEL